MAIKPKGGKAQSIAISLCLRGFKLSGISGFFFESSEELKEMALPEALCSILLASVLKEALKQNNRTAQQRHLCMNNYLALSKRLATSSQLITLKNAAI